MFGKNEIVGKSYFKDQADNTLLVTSRFLTLQGEGPYRGERAFFVRLAKCQLSCSFCDTYFDSGDSLTFDQVIDHYSKLATSKKIPGKIVITPTGLVVTGGEPSLQPNLGKFLEAATPIFAWTQIESNGILLANVPDSTTYVVSPKCVEKDGVAIKYLEPNKDVLNRADCLKFVMSAPTDKYSPYSEVPQWAHEWQNRTGKQIFVSPMNIYLSEPKKSKQLRAAKNDITIDDRSMTDEKISFWEEGLLDMKANQLNHEYTAQYCLDHGFIFNMQLHLFASMA